MFTFIGDHFLFVVCGAFALFAAVMIWASVSDALWERRHRSGSGDRFGSMEAANRVSGAQ